MTALRPPSLAGKVAIVAGAGTSGRAGDATGNGTAAALAFAEAGAEVVCVDISEAAARSAADRIRKAGGSAMAYTADISDTTRIAELMRVVDQTFGRLDILHNNVRVVNSDTLAAFDEDRFKRTFEVNVQGTALCCHHALPLMKRSGGGAIINVTAVAGSRAYENLFSYSVTNAAVEQMTRVIAREAIADAVRCNAISLGIIEAPVAMDVYTALLGDVDQARARLQAYAPGGQLGSVWDGARLAVFLASDAGKYINAAVLPVDAGARAFC
ncbi:SDR family NAD(P)-dependent oxidoreductase [Phenylobacterium sp.]|uniref:SDR family NAD(P)-dependent oxidoreductase n=1 Tax=Phenylobacterium sp. TaxID=1871053 RepID=UPI0035B1EF3E